MSRIPDINAKIAYLTRKVNGKAILKSKRPIYLRDRVKGGSKQFAGTKGSLQCSNESNAFLACLEENDFLDANCVKELKVYMDCEKRIQDSKRFSAEKLRKGETVNGVVDSSVINEQLRKYRNPIDKEALTVQQNLLNTLPNNRIKPFPHRNKQNPYPTNDNGLTVPD